MSKVSRLASISSRIGLLCLFCFILAFWLTVLLPGTLILTWVALALGVVGLAAALAGGIERVLGSRPENRDTILKYVADVALLDNEGKKVDVCIRRTFRTRASQLRTFQWRFGGGNGLGIDSVSVSPGEVSDFTESFGQSVITQRFPRPIPRLRTAEIEFRGCMMDAFRNPEGEFWQTTIAYPTRRMVLHISFPRGRRPESDSVITTERIGQSEFLIDVDSLRITEDPGGGLGIEWELSHPRQFATYRFSWKWESKPQVLQKPQEPEGIAL